MTKNTTIALVAIFLIGIVYRLWFASLVPQPVINDKLDYRWFSLQMLQDPHMLAAHTFRTYPTSLMDALIYKVAGYENLRAVFIVQAVMDSAISLMIFYVLSRGLKLRKAAWVGAILYSLNPFTAGYVNVILSEILMVFCMATTAVTGILLLKKPSVLRGCLLGIAAGLTAETRNAAFAWTAVPIGLLFFFIPFKKHIGVYVAILAGLLLTVLYPLAANWRAYHVINITTLDDMYAREFYDGVIIKELAPLAPPLPEATYQMYAEYHTEYTPAHQNNAWRNAMIKKYYTLAWNLIKKNPWDYIQTRFHKMWFVWQKEALYVYVEPGYASHKIYTYFANLILLALAVIGLIYYPVKTFKTATGKWVRFMILGSFLYATFAFSFTQAEGRLTIPFYPLVILAAALGISQIMQTIQLIYRNHQQK